MLLLLNCYLSNGNPLLCSTFSLSLSLSATECEATVSGSDGLLIGELSKIIVEWMGAGEVRR